MPKTKARKPSTDSDSGPDDRNTVVPSKKAKSAKPTSTTDTGTGEAYEQEDTWQLGSNRSVKLTEFKHKWYINIREYYNADGVLKPGKKGIMLTMEQWHRFKTCIPELEEAIKRKV